MVIGNAAAELQCARHPQLGDWAREAAGRAPLVGIARSGGGSGYWLAAADGAVYPFGDAVDHGSMKNRLAPGTRVVGIVGRGDGYYLAGNDGGVFGFHAPFHGSANPKHITDVVAIALTRDQNGYWLLGSHGGVYPFGSATAAAEPVVWPEPAPPTCGSNCNQQQRNAMLIVSVAQAAGIGAQYQGWMVGVAACESGLDETKVNTHDEPYHDSGLFQFTRDTWAGKRRQYFGGTKTDIADALNARDNAETAAAVVKNEGFPSVWHDDAGHLDPYLAHKMQGTPLPGYCVGALQAAGRGDLVD